MPRHFDIALHYVIAIFIRHCFFFFHYRHTDAIFASLRAIYTLHHVLQLHYSSTIIIRHYAAIAAACRHFAVIIIMAHAMRYVISIIIRFAATITLLSPANSICQYLSPVEWLPL